MPPGLTAGLHPPAVGQTFADKHANTQADDGEHEGREHPKGLAGVPAERAEDEGAAGNEQSSQSASGRRTGERCVWGSGGVLGEDDRVAGNGTLSLGGWKGSEIVNPV